MGVGVGVTVSVAGGAAQHPGEPRQECSADLRLGRPPPRGLPPPPPPPPSRPPRPLGLQPRKHPAVHPSASAFPTSVASCSAAARSAAAARRASSPRAPRRHRRLGRRLRRRRLRQHAAREGVGSHMDVDAINDGPDALALEKLKVEAGGGSTPSDDANSRKAAAIGCDESASTAEASGSPARCHLRARTRTRLRA